MNPDIKQLGDLSEKELKEIIGSFSDGDRGKNKYERERSRRKEKKKQFLSNTIRFSWLIFVGILQATLIITLGFAAIGGLAYFVESILK